MERQEVLKEYAKRYYYKNKNRKVTREDINDKIVERLFNKVDKTDTCWNWTGAVTAYRPERPFAPATKGYGVMSVTGKPMYVHRLSWLIHRGELAEGLVIDHLCENTLCVNPSHMQQVTNKENTERSPKHTKNGAKYLKTHCKNGHERTPEMRGRQCTVCYRQKHKARDGYCKRGHLRPEEIKGKPCPRCQKMRRLGLI